MSASVDSTKSTEATDLATRRVIELATGSAPDAYPDDVVFIPADIPDFGQALGRALLERSPIVVVYPDGRERLIEPVDPLSAMSHDSFWTGRVLGRLEGLFRRRH